MAGLIDEVQSSLLKQTIGKAEATVPPKYQRGYHAIMAAGLKMMFDQGTFKYTEEYLRSIKSPQDVPKIVAHGVVKLISLIFNSTKGKMPLEPSGTAAIVLMCHALEYVEREMKLPITPDLLAQTTHMVSQGLALFLKQATKMSDEDFQRAMTPQRPAPGKPGVKQGAA